MLINIINTTSTDKLQEYYKTIHVKPLFLPVYLIYYY